MSIVNPLGIAFVFREMTIWATPSERAALAQRIAIYALAVILSSYFFGNLVLGFFGIGVPSLRIAGGLVVATSGFALLNAPDPGANAPQAMDTAPVMQMAFFPLTMPLTTGPGTISVAIALGAGRAERADAEKFSAAAGFVAAAMVMAVLIWLCYRNADRLSRVVGVEGTRVVTRLSAFLLLCVGVQIIATGITELVRPLIAGGGRGLLGCARRDRLGDQFDAWRQRPVRADRGANLDPGARCRANLAGRRRRHRSAQVQKITAQRREFIGTQGLVVGGG